MTEDVELGADIVLYWSRDRVEIDGKLAAVKGAKVNNSNITCLKTNKNSCQSSRGRS